MGIFQCCQRRPRSDQGRVDVSAEDLRLRHVLLQRYHASGCPGETNMVAGAGRFGATRCLHAPSGNGACSRAKLWHHCYSKMLGLRGHPGQQPPPHPPGEILSLPCPNKDIAQSQPRYSDGDLSYRDRVSSRIRLASGFQTMLCF